MRVIPLLAGVSALVILVGGGAYWSQGRSQGLPPDIAVANGRVEVERVDIAAKLPGRIAEITVREGDLVAPGDTIARLDDAEARARLQAARAAVRRAREGISRAEAELAIREAEHGLSEVELRRAVELARRAAGPETEVDRRRAHHKVTSAMILGARAALADAAAAQEAAEADVAQVEAVLKEHVLTAPVGGRIEYRLAHAGEVVPGGGRIVTLLDLRDVFMTVFLPTSQAGRLALGSEARIVLDAAPEFVIPARVSFVAAEAQFTPKAVETADERAKLMYRVKLSIDPELLARYQPYVRAGLTGRGYVKLSPEGDWPAQLTPRLPDAAS